MRGAAACTRREVRHMAGEAALVLKLTGSAMILCGASGCGLWMSGRYRERLKLLEQLRQMVFLLKGQILYANATLAEAFEAVGRRTEGCMSELFGQAAERIRARPEESFAQLWAGIVADIGGEEPLTKADRQSLAAMGEHLGFLDREMQERNLLLYLEQLDLTIGELREHRQERCRLYSSLGVMGGLFLVILLS